MRQVPTETTSEARSPTPAKAEDWQFFPIHAILVILVWLRFPILPSGAFSGRVVAEPAWEKMGS